MTTDAVKAPDDVVALLVDFENIRYGYLNEFHEEIDIALIMEKARRHGLVSVALAYADFNEQPPELRRQLGIVGITTRDIPVRKYFQNETERVKNAVDFHIMNDIWEIVLDRPNINTFVLMTGDSDFLRIVTILRNRFGKKVIICGTSGTISQDLAAAADEVDHFEIAPISREAVQTAVKQIVLMIAQKIPTVGFWTVPQIKSWALNERNEIPGTAREIGLAVDTIVHDVMIVRRLFPDSGNGREVTKSFLNPRNAAVVAILAEAGLSIPEEDIGGVETAADCGNGNGDSAEPFSAGPADADLS